MSDPVRSWVLVDHRDFAFEGENHGVWPTSYHLAGNTRLELSEGDLVAFFAGAKGFSAVARLVRPRAVDERSTLWMLYGLAEFSSHVRLENEEDRAAAAGALFDHLWKRGAARRKDELRKQRELHDAFSQAQLEGRLPPNHFAGPPPAPYDKRAERRKFIARLMREWPFENLPSARFRPRELPRLWWAAIAVRGGADGELLDAALDAQTRPHLETPPAEMAAQPGDPIAAAAATTVSNSRPPIIAEPVGPARLLSGSVCVALEHDDEQAAVDSTGIIARRGERVAKLFFEEKFRDRAAEVHNVAATESWDLEIVFASGEKLYVEVKAGKDEVTEVVLTDREWEAAVAKGDTYWLALVSQCLSENPEEKAWRNPAQLVDSRSLELRRFGYRLCGLASLTSQRD